MGEELGMRLPTVQKQCCIAAVMCGSYHSYHEQVVNTIDAQLSEMRELKNSTYYEATRPGNEANAVVVYDHDLNYLFFGSVPDSELVPTFEYIGSHC